MKIHTDKILVTGACGQLGSELTAALRKIHGDDNVIASDLHPKAGIAELGPFEKLDVLDAQKLGEIVTTYNIKQIYHLAAVLSATGEQNPKLAWKINVDSLLHVLDIANEKKLHKVYWPSSIAAFGPHTPGQHTPQHTIMDPSTVYGISKIAGERWCEYYSAKYNVDIRSLRYPGLISYKTPPGGGTTDYAVEIYHKALEADATYTCFLSQNTYLPMMYMPDAIQATLQIMNAEASLIKVRSSYNVGAFSFSPKEIAAEIKRHIPGFSISYQPDFRQKIAESWPQSIDDTVAREDWGWQPQFTLATMTKDMLMNLKSFKTKVLA